MRNRRGHRPGRQYATPACVTPDAVIAPLERSHGDVPEHLLQQYEMDPTGCA
jgi:hypothetical protein